VQQLPQNFAFGFSEEPPALAKYRYSPKELHQLLKEIKERPFL
jgi:hypothetical protein